MNLKPFLIGGIVAYFITKKSSSNKTTSTGNKSNVFIRPGYTITDCKTITINDEQKALKQAFKYGANYKHPIDVDDCLFGGTSLNNPAYGCRLTLDLKDPKIAKFFYNLSLYYLAGAVNEGKIKVEDFAEGLNINRLAFEKEKIDTSQWLTEKDIPQIIEENK